MLVLDEATAAVDTATDERIQTTIRFNIDLELYSILFSSTYIIWLEDFFHPYHLDSRFSLRNVLQFQNWVCSLHCAHYCPQTEHCHRLKTLQRESTKAFDIYVTTELYFSLHNRRKHSSGAGQGEASRAGEREFLHFLAIKKHPLGSGALISSYLTLVNFGAPSRYWGL